MNNIAQYYAVLKIDKAASPEIVKQAYRQLAKVWHPDRYINDPIQQAKAETEIKRINQAYAAIKSYLGEVPSLQEDNIHTSQVSTRQNTANFYYRQGVDCAEQKNYDDALTSFAQAIKLDANYLEAYQYRGYILSKLGYKYRAKAEFDKADRIKAKNKVQSKTDNERHTVKTQANSYLRCRRTIIAGNQAVTSAILSPDNQTFISVNSDREIKLWELNTGQRITTLRGHTDMVTSLAIASQGKTLVSGSKDKTIKIWDLKEREIIKTLGGRFSGHSERIEALAISPDDRTLLSCSADKTIKIWDLNRGKVVHSISFSASLTCLKISPNGQFFCSGGLEPQLRIRKVEDGQVVRSLNNNSGILSMAFSPDGKVLATGGFDLLIRLWNVNTGKKIRVMSGHLDLLSSLAFSHDGKTLISSSWDRTIKIWQLATGKEISSIEAHSNKIQTLAIASNSKTIISGDADCRIKIWHSTF